MLAQFRIWRASARFGVNGHDVVFAIAPFPTRDNDP